MKINRTIDGQVIYTPDEDDKPTKAPEPLVQESDPMCYLPQCLCKDHHGAPDPFCDHYRKLHVQEIPKGVIIA